MAWSGEVQPATMDQVYAGRDGKFVTITEDVGGAAEALKQIDKRLCLRWSEKGEYFVVYCREEWQREGEGHLVGTFQELDQRIVRSIEETMWKWRQPGFNFADELEKREAAAEEKAEHEWSERFGESAERLAHAIRKDLNLDQRRIFVPEGIGGE